MRAQSHRTPGSASRTRNRRRGREGGREGVGVGWETIECVGDVVNDSSPESNLGLNICRRSAHLQGEFRERSPLRQLASAFLHAITIVVRPFIHSQQRRRAALMGSLSLAPHSPSLSMISPHRHPPIRDPPNDPNAHFGSPHPFAHPLACSLSLNGTPAHRQCSNGGGNAKNIRRKE